MRVSGVVLAGGQSRRFGRDKAQEMFRGMRLIDWSIRALTPHVDDIVIAGGSLAGFETVPDQPRGGLGPLGGIAGAMRVAAARGSSHILSVPCDTPILPGDLFDRLLAEPSAAFHPECPVIGIWPVALGAGLEAWLADAGNLAVRAWTDRIGAVPLAGAGPIVNINRPEDLARYDSRPD